MNNRTMSMISILFLVLTFTMTNQSFAEIQFHLSPMSGIYLLEGNRNISDTIIGGLGLGVSFNDHFSAEMFLLYSDLTINYYDKASHSCQVDDDTPGYIYHFDLLYHFNPIERLTPYLAVGIGGINISSDYVDYIYEADRTDSCMQLNYGAGFRYRLTDAIDVRGDIRHLFSPDSRNNELTVLGGLSFAFGFNDQPIVEQKPSDSDHDGVIDSNDKCPDTPLNQSVDQAGCPKPMDDDKDGVFNEKDRCPNTPPNTTVRADGCPVDSDNDGIHDGKDQCPKTPKHAIVDSKGCPKDSDNDGVYDGIDQCANSPSDTPVDKNGCTQAPDADQDGIVDSIDQCPNTLHGIKVDPKGCPYDTDHDGVSDDIDQCANTPKNVAVDNKGCPLDSDNDGIADHVDQCANTPKNVAVDNKGCPLDSDQDGIADHVDQCANTPKNIEVDHNGCPLDSDHDGISDHLDQCANTPKNVAVDNKGCPLDSDNDGVSDNLDQCANTPKNLAVDNKGCPLDSDHDGIADNQDQCPDTPESTPVDFNGCPIQTTQKEEPVFDTLEIRHQVIESIVQNKTFPIPITLKADVLFPSTIKFDPKHLQMTVVDHKELERAANFMTYNPTSMLIIEAHTYQDTLEESNNYMRALSLGKMVRKYLVDQFHLDPVRIRIFSFGSERLLPNIPQDNIANHRVEVSIIKFH